MKPGIFTFTPNPVLDMGGTVDKVIPNEKVYVASETRSPGGNGINAGRIIHRLGAPVTLTGFLGGGIGAELKALLRKEKMPLRFIDIQQDTRIGITVSSLASHTQTRLSFAGPRLKAADKNKFFAELQRMPAGSLLLLGGSLPPGMGIADVRKIIHRGHARNIGVIVDVPAEILRDVVKSRPLLIKPNLHELQQMLNTKASSVNAVLKQAQRLNEWVPLVCVSSVEGGAMLVTRECAWYGKIPKVKVNSVVGAGDSMVGAITTALWKKSSRLKQTSWQERFLEVEDVGDLLRWGLAASCASLAHRGTKLGSGAEIREFYNKTKVEKLGSTKHG